MQLLEHDAKELAARFGIPVPSGGLAGEAALPPGPWIVKAQVPVGGRGKAGAIRLAATPDAVAAEVAALLGGEVRGHLIHSVRVEQAMPPGTPEAYIALMLDPAAGGIRVLAAEGGGVEVETSDRIRAATSELASANDALARATEGLPPALRDAASHLLRMFLALEATLLEVNPLFLLPDGGWVAGDMKLVTDDNALFRQPVLTELLERRSAAYPEVARKLRHGFDYIVLDPEGDIGLLTTGAGLSMMLVDELRAAGHRPHNFLDIRTGGMRGDPARLVQVLRWLHEGPNIRVVLVNIFAGITDLGEFAMLLLRAREAVPELDVPFVVRLAGTHREAACRILGEAGIPVVDEIAEAVALL
jgi:succinyl-CoA synthetase beta subunit